MEPRYPFSAVEIFSMPDILAQGMLSLPREDDPVIPRVWLRPSQIKIQYPLESPLDPALLIINVLCPSRLKTPAHLSSETIINLAENGVPHHVFTDMLRASLEERVAGLTTWEGPGVMLELWRNVARCGGVLNARRAREAGGEARARGYGDREAEDVEGGDEDDLQLLNAAHQRSKAWWTDEISGCPSTLEDTVMVLLDSGFTPKNCAVLRKKLEAVVKKTINSNVFRFRIEVAMSCSAFLIPGRSPYSNI
jgi:RNA-dependent RNA polymerase